MYVGLDISKTEMVGVWKDYTGNKIEEHIFPTTDKGIESLVKHLQGCEVVLEASTSGVFVYDSLLAKGITAKVANPNQIKLISHSDKKTDRSDAEKLAELLRRNAVPLCYMPDRETREMRDIIKYRKTLVKITTILKNRTRSILRREGIDIEQKDIFGTSARANIEKQKLDDSKKKAVDDFVSLGLVVKKEIEKYDENIENKADSGKQTLLLQTMPGISHNSAVHIMSAIGDIKRFPSDEELASYAGLVPRIYQSGNTSYTRGLKPGDRLLKSTMIQCANAAIRTSPKLRKYFLKKQRKKNYQKAIIAIARKMIEIIYCMLTRGEEYRE